MPGRDRWPCAGVIAQTGASEPRNLGGAVPTLTTVSALRPEKPGRRCLRVAQYDVHGLINRLPFVKAFFATTYLSLPG
jgi:hypothetical protein